MREMGLWWVEKTGKGEETSTEAPGEGGGRDWSIAEKGQKQGNRGRSETRILSQNFKPFNQMHIWMFSLNMKHIYIWFKSLKLTRNIQNARFERWRNITACRRFLLLRADLMACFLEWFPLEGRRWLLKDGWWRTVAGGAGSEYVGYRGLGLGKFYPISGAGAPSLDPIFVNSKVRVYTDYVTIKFLINKKDLKPMMIRKGTEN